VQLEQPDQQLREQLGQLVLLAQPEKLEQLAKPGQQEQLVQWDLKEQEELILIVLCAIILAMRCSQFTVGSRIIQSQRL
jgi:hypothetical protein